MDKERFVREGFGRIARRYDLANALLSFGLDRLWRKRTVLALGRRQPVLDLCAGTLALSAEYRRRFGPVVYALDFSLPMLRVGLRKGVDGIRVICGNALELPFRDETFWGVMMAFGLRNLVDIRKGLGEMYRVLKSGGKAVILEFGMPKNPLFAPLYRLYLSRFLPAIGRLLTGDPVAYRYLYDSIMAFPSKEEVLRQMRKVGFCEPSARDLTLGVCVLYEGWKP